MSLAPDAATSPPAPVRREIRVRCDQATAYELFTAHIGAWWPLATHSVFGAAASVAFEDGLLVERVAGQASVWGEVLSSNRPHGFTMTWHPGRGRDEATELELVFAADGDGTLVTLTHRGWERLGARAEEARADYERGWQVVLSGYAARVEPAPSRRDEPAESGEPGDRWFVLTHRPGPALVDGGSVFAHPLFAEHAAFLGRLADRGWLVAAGPVDAAQGEGMTVVRVTGQDADAVTDLARSDDLAVAGGLLAVEVRPWDVRAHG